MKDDSNHRKRRGRDVDEDDVEQFVSFKKGNKSKKHKGKHRS